MHLYEHSSSLLAYAHTVITIMIFFLVSGIFFLCTTDSDKFATTDVVVAVVVKLSNLLFSSFLWLFCQLLDDGGSALITCVMCATQLSENLLFFLRRRGNHMYIFSVVRVKVLCLHFFFRGAVAQITMFIFFSWLWMDSFFLTNHCQMSKRHLKKSFKKISERISHEQNFIRSCFSLSKTIFSAAVCILPLSGREWVSKLKIKEKE